MKSTQVTGLKTCKVDLGLTFGLTQVIQTNYLETDMLVTGKMDSVMEKVLFIIQTEASMKETGVKISRKVTVFLLLRMVQNMKVLSNKTAWSIE